MKHARALSAVVCALLLMAGAGCGKDDPKGGASGSAGGAGSCKPLKVTVDGAEVAGLAHGLGLLQKRGGDQSYQVQVFNHGGVTCEQVLSTSGRAITVDDEVAVRANAGKDTMSRGVGIAPHSQLGVDVTLMGTAPTEAGQPLSLCVPATTFTPRIGDYKDKKVTIEGTFTGAYCGAMEL